MSLTPARKRQLRERMTRSYNRCRTMDGDELDRWLTKRDEWIDTLPDEEEAYVMEVYWALTLESSIVDSTIPADAWSHQPADLAEAAREIPL